MLLVVSQPCLSIVLDRGDAGALINDGQSGASAGEIKREAAAVCIISSTYYPDSVFVEHAHCFIECFHSLSSLPPSLA